MEGATDPNSLTVSADHCDIGERLTESGTFNDLGGNIDARPLFEKGQGALHQEFGFPTIDRGTCEGAPPADFEGDPRPSGADCDIGADELVP